MDLAAGAKMHRVRFMGAPSSSSRGRAPKLESVRPSREASRFQIPEE